MRRVRWQNEYYEQTRGWRYGIRSTREARPNFSSVGQTQFRQLGLRQGFVPPRYVSRIDNAGSCARAFIPLTQLTASLTSSLSGRSRQHKTRRGYIAGPTFPCRLLASGRPLLSGNWLRRSLYSFIPAPKRMKMQLRRREGGCSRTPKGKKNEATTASSKTFSWTILSDRDHLI